MKNKLRLQLEQLAYDIIGPYLPRPCSDHIIVGDICPGLVITVTVGCCPSWAKETVRTEWEKAMWLFRFNRGKHREVELEFGDELKENKSIGKGRAICLELDNDVDDFVAYKYLEAKNAVDYVVLSPEPYTPEGKARKKEIHKPIFNDFVAGTTLIYNGGSFTKIAKFVDIYRLEFVVANGGFVGSNLEPNPLKKFKGKREVRTFNFNIDRDAAHKVLCSKNIGKVILTGKNVCHDPRNVCGGDWWAGDSLLETICAKYNVREGKLQHDLLAFVQGLRFATGNTTMFDYVPVKPYMVAGDAWGSEFNSESSVYAAVGRPS